MAGVGPSPEATAAVQKVQEVEKVAKVEKVEKAAMTKVTSSTEIAKRKLKHILSSRALQIIKETMILEAQKEAQEKGEKDTKKITSNQAAAHGRGKGEATSPQDLPAPVVNRKVITTRSGRVVKPSRKARENQQNTM
ncbi:hypothetical protein N0V85_003756 [Neurospora sp. IMI 360204]|nr:hypothetical protein N0V85_003756 [Neurospora sp. IMI 360204]